MSQYACAECRAEVSENARRCPHCGYNAGEKILKRANRQQKLGGLLSLLLVTFPIGFPIFLWGTYWKRKAKQRTVTEI